MDQINKIGEYEVVEELMHGSLTSIYKAYQPSLNRTVLIKKLHQKLVSEKDIQERFVREAQVCAKISHPNIVEVYDFKASPEATYLVLEFVEGKNLTELMINAPFQLPTVLSLASQILKGVRYAHEHGIIHRDIKPDNIMVSDKGIVKISDFGLAFIEGSHSLTRQGMVLGTPAYMSPEQAAGKKVDFKSDLFSIGITIFEMLTGVNIFKSDSLTECLRKIISEPIPKLSDYRNDINVRLDKIINKMLEKNPAKRYDSCAEADAALTQYAEESHIFLNKEVIEKFINNSAETSVKSTIKIDSTRSKARQRNRIRTALAVSLMAIGSAASLMIFLTKYGGNTDPSAMEAAQDSMSIVEKIEADTLPLNDPEELFTANHEELNGGGNEKTVNSKPAVEKKSSNLKNDPADSPQENKTRNLKQTGSDIVNENEKSHNISEKSEETVAALPVDTTPGYLTVDANPYVYVYIDDVSLGATPLLKPIELPNGEHQIRFVRTDLDVSTSRTIKIKPGERRHETVDVWNYLSKVWISDCDPWAYLYVDGELQDTIPPFNNPMILSIGIHKIELRNPAFKPWIWEHEFIEGAVTETLSVKLEPLETMSGEIIDN